MTKEKLAFLRKGIEADDIAAVEKWFAENPDALSFSGSDACPSPKNIFASVRSAKIADLFLQHGVTVGMVSEWWASGFGLEKVSPAVAEHLIARGAVVTPHAAAALGLTEHLRHLLDRQNDLVHAKGGDGARPLHFSRTLEIAQLLVKRGAELDPRDDDHDSTPAQWRIGDAPDVTRFLLRRGAKADIFIAAGLGDLELAKTLVAANPNCTSYRIGNNHGPFPGIGHKARGGTIYQWTLGFNQSPQEIAYHRGHRELYEFLMSHTPARSQLLIACMLANRSLAEETVAAHPGLISDLDQEDRQLLAKSCWETNLNREVVRLMLDLGFPIDVPEFNHGYLPLHNAAWCGDAELVELLLQRGHPVDRRDQNHQATALGYSIHSCVVAKRHPEGDFPRVVRLLLEAGTPLSKGEYPTGNQEIDAVIAAHSKSSL
jgi:ankyrin repeat protein